MDDKALNIFLAIVTSLVAVVSMIVSVAQSRITQDLASRGLKIELYNQKLLLTPKIVFKYRNWPHYPLSPTGIFLLHLYNVSKGTIEIDDILVQGEYQVDQTQMKFPVTLLMNNPVLVHTVLRADTKEQLNMYVEHQEPLQRNLFLTETGNNYIRDSFIQVSVRDSLGNKYLLNCVPDMATKQLNSEAPIEV